MKYVPLYALFYFLFISAYTQAQPFATYNVNGQVKDVCGTPDVYHIKLRRGRYLYGALSDEKGNFTFIRVQPGRYYLSVWHKEYLQYTDSLVINDHSIQDLKLTIACKGTLTPLPQEPAYLLSCELKHLPNRNAMVCGLPAGTTQRGNEVSLHGYVLYIDGIKMRHSYWIPQAATQEVDIWRMSIPANLDYSP